MKRNFLTGIVIVLPLAITIWLMSILIKVCTAPFTSIVKSLLDRLAIIESGFWIFSADQILHGIATITIVACLFALLSFIGLVSRLLYLHMLVKGLERLIARIPLISKIYKACREITDILFAPRGTSVTRVVWAPAPTPSQGLLGFTTNEISIKTFGGGKENYVSVFTPGTPNPTNSFLLLCQEKSLVSTDLSVEESLKWVVSCGSSKPTNFLKATTAIAKKIESGFS